LLASKEADDDNDDDFDDEDSVKRKARTSTFEMSAAMLTLISMILLGRWETFLAMRVTTSVMMRVTTTDKKMPLRMPLRMAIRAAPLSIARRAREYCEQ